MYTDKSTEKTTTMEDELLSFLSNHVMFLKLYIGKLDSKINHYMDSGHSSNGGNA